MADFKTHITASSMLGLAYGGVAYAMYDVPLSTSVLAGGLCSVSGMLPDIDSNSGRPLRESLAFGAAVVPMMLIDRFEQLGLTPEAIVLAGALIYLLIRFGLAKFLREYTVHRGMFHSLPAAVIFGEIAFLLTSGNELGLRIYKAGGVVIGYLCHLGLDELYSVEWYRGRLRLKRSFGTALKMYSDKIWPNISAYAKLALFTYIVLHEPTWMEQFEAYRHRVEAHLEKRHEPLMETQSEPPDTDITNQPGDSSPSQSTASQDPAQQPAGPLDDPFFSQPQNTGAVAGDASFLPEEPSLTPADPSAPLPFSGADASVGGETYGGDSSTAQQPSAPRTALEPTYESDPRTY